MRTWLRTWVPVVIGGVVIAVILTVVIVAVWHSGGGSVPADPDQCPGGFQIGSC